MQKKRIVLCADDYGQAQNISAGIIHCLQKKRLSAVSCIVNSDVWPNDGACLKAFNGSNEIDVGLHFNLTEGRPLSKAYQKKYGSSFASLSNVLFCSLLKRYEIDTIVQEFSAQLERFIQYYGRPPTHIDGHQHIHQFAQIRDSIILAYQSHFRTEKPYLRLVKDHTHVFSLKKMIIHLSGTKPFEQMLNDAKIPHNKSFAGIYNFFAKTNVPYRLLFQNFLSQIDDFGVIMCHPGLEATQNNDPIALARMREYNYLMSEAFSEDCQNHEVVLSRFEEG